MPRIRFRWSRKGLGICHIILYRWSKIYKGERNDQYTRKSSLEPSGRMYHNNTHISRQKSDDPDLDKGAKNQSQDEVGKNRNMSDNFWRMSWNLKKEVGIPRIMQDELELPHRRLRIIRTQIWIKEKRMTNKKTSQRLRWLGRKTCGS